jgi:SAM-dependent MidA family methyltransferase
MLLRDIIIEKIKTKGPISFCDFMEMALYFPELGYYTSNEEKFGKGGDYYTSPVLSSLYGEMLGKQLEEMWFFLDKKPFSIVEYGAGAGDLCFDILNYLEKNTELFNELTYFIIEKGEGLKNIQQKRFPEKVEWIKDIKEISGFSGCILSNEVLDNFAVNVVEMKEELMEIFIDYQNEFIEIFKPASSELKEYLKAQNIELPKGYRTEINLEAIQWIQNIAKHLQKGFVITIDYGYPANEYYSAKRSTGTLACYYKHTVTDQYYDNIGQQDITAHVNFSALNIWGKKAGLELTGFTNQNYFLRSLGLVNYLRKIEMETTPNNRAQLFQVNKLLMDMGSKFKVLIQQKGIKSKMLSGMQFSQPLY